MLKKKRNVVRVEKYLVLQNKSIVVFAKYAASQYPMASAFLMEE